MITSKLVDKIEEYRTAVGQVAHVVLEGGEPGDRLAVDPEAGHGVGDALLGVGHHREDVAAQLAERRALRLVQAVQVFVNIGGRHQLPPRSTRSWSTTRTRSPGCLAMAFRSAALIGSLWRPSPSAMKEL